MKWIKRMTIGILIIAIIALVIVHFGMNSMKFTDEDAYQYFQERGFDGDIEMVDVEGTSVKVVSSRSNSSDSICLIFVHGAPGSWDAFKTYMTDKDLNSIARVVAYDRPGYGGSEKSCYARN